MKRIVSLFFLLALVPLASTAQQLPPPPPAPPQAPLSPPPPPPAMGKWWKNAEVVRTLGLSDAQVTQIESVYLQHQPMLSGLRTALLQEDERLRALLESDRMDERAISAQTQAVAGARMNLTAENSEMTLGMRRMMTAVQWRKLEQLRRELAVPPAPPVPHIAGRPVYDLSTVYDVSTPGLTEPEVVVKPLPQYTPEAKAAKVEGLVLLRVTIRRDGTVEGATVLRDPGYGLAESAVKCVTTQWRFRPATLNGQPVNVRANIEISFRLQ